MRGDAAFRREPKASAPGEERIMTSHGVAVVGTGFIGPVHVEGLRRAGQRVVGLLGSSPERSRAATDALGVPRAYATFDEVLADPDVEAIHLATPNRLHFEQASRALAAGKHVMCEKPLAMTSAESAELVRRARASGRAAGVCYNVRFYPLCLEAADRVRRGEVGTVYHVAGSYVQDWLLHDTDFNWRVLAADGGELRAVADIGTHWLDLVRFVTGLEVASVCADLHTVWPVRRRPAGGVETFSGKTSGPRPTTPVGVTTDDYGCVMLRFTGGAHGVVWVSQVTAGRKNCLRFEVAGSRTALAWESETPERLWIGHRDRPNELLSRDPALLGDAARRHTDYPGGHAEGYPDTFKQLFRAFYAAIDRGDFAGPAPPFPTFLDGHREIVLCEAVLASHRGRCWVDVSGEEP
jgi:predicted dehydrogenase